MKGSRANWKSLWRHINGKRDRIIPNQVSSLSAILLNDDFYDFMMKGRRTVDGISVLDASYLIPFKMYAWIDLSDRKVRGEHVNEKDLKKHKYDVFRLLEIINADEAIEVSGMVKESIRVFLDRIQEEELSLAQIGLSISKEQGIQQIQSLYKL